MRDSLNIPVFTLFGETAEFPDVVHCETFSARAPVHGWAISAHRHSNMSQVLVVKDGEVTASLDGTETVLANETYLFVPSQVVHEFVFKPDTIGQVISFPQSILSSIGPTAPDLSNALATPSFGPASKALVTLTDTLSQTLSTTHPFRQQVAVGLAHSILGMIASEAALRTTRHQGPTSTRIDQLRSLIVQNQHLGWGPTEYAASLSISTGHLSRLCRAASGVGASAFIERSTMEEACRMLAFTRISVAEIGYRLGYADPSYFSKRFRRLRAQTPSDYRQKFTS